MEFKRLALEDLNEGVRVKDQDFIFDYNEDKYEDIVNLIDAPAIYQDKIFNNVYWFGYKFNENSSREERSQFINYIKGLSNNTQIDQKELERFINKPLITLHTEELNVTDIDCIVYPKSERSPLVNQILKCVGDVCSRTATKPSYELVKNLPANIEFDWELFFLDNPTPDQQQVYFINNILVPKIKNLDYFSIAKNVKPKYRRYIKNFLNFKTEQDKKAFESIEAGNILVVDDINTSGSTLNEILRIINGINKECKIYIFTLLGK